MSACSATTGKSRGRCSRGSTSPIGSPPSKHLRESETLQRMVLDRLPAVVWTTDRDLRFTFSTGGGLASLSLGSGQVALVGTSLYSYFRTSDPSHPGIAPHLRALQGQSLAFEMTGLSRSFQTRIEPLRDRNENSSGASGSHWT